MPRLLRLTLVVLAVLALLHCQLTEGKKPSKSSSSKSKSTLVNVQIVSRHGTRAPNPVVQQICPTERDNLARYGDLRLTLAGLTGTGQRQLYALGMYTRQTYIERTYPGFLSDFFNDEEVYFRAVGEDRTIQSAVCMGHGMYPKGTAAVGYFADLPSPVPVYTLPDKYDALLEVRKEDCAPRLKKDAAKWDEDEGIKLYQANEPLIQRMLDMCNITDLNEVIVGSGDNYGDAIKDITDAWTFDMNEGFPPIAGLNYSSLLEFRTMAVKQLLGRIIGTEEQIVYMNGQLPERMITNFHTAIANQGAPPASTHRLKMYAYHGHREMMYALGALLGIDYDIDFPGLPKGAIPPGTTLFFELHYHGELLEDGSIPNAWEAANMTNPYLHRMVLPADLPPVRPKFGAKPVAMTNSAWQDANKEKKHPEKNGDYDEDDDGKTKTISPHHPRAPADKTPTRTGEDELNHVDPKDRPTKGTIPTNTSDSNVASSSSSSNSSSHHSVLPHPSLHKKSPLVKVSDDRMPPPPVQHYTVRAYLWHPCGVGKIEEDESSKNTKQNKESKKRRLAKLKGDGDDDDDDSYDASHEADCPSVPVKMSAICDSYECSMEDFQTKLESRIQRTGTWDELCGVPPSRVHKVAADVAAVEQLSKGDVERPTATRMTMVDTTSQADVPTKSHSLRWFLLLVVAFLAFAGYSKYRSMSPTGSPREEYISYTQNEFDEAAPLQRIY